MLETGTEAQAMPQPTPLLEVENLSLSFAMYCKGLHQTRLKVISDLSLTVYPGEILAVAGSSGSGKSLLAHAVLGLLPHNAQAAGDIRYKGEALTHARQKALRGREIALIPQSVTYLDPLMQVGVQARGVAGTKGATARQIEVFRRLGLDEATEKLYPFQLSGGMARRVLFSTAVIDGAQLILADEPTPGMHVEQAVEALALLRQLADSGKGVVLITHDIDLALHVADRIAVFYAGTTVEETPAADFAAGPQALRHPYTKALWAALPQNGFQPVPGFQPYAGALPPGCLYAPRCPQKTEGCEAQSPPFTTVRGGKVRCPYAT